MVEELRKSAGSAHAEAEGQPVAGSTLEREASPSGLGSQVKRGDQPALACPAAHRWAACAIDANDRLRSRLECHAQRLTSWTSSASRRGAREAIVRASCESSTTLRLAGIGARTTIPT